MHARNQLAGMKTACPHRPRTPCARRPPGKRAPFSLARPHVPSLPQRRRGARVKLRLRCAAHSRALALRPLSAAGRTRDAWLREKGFCHPFPQNGEGESELVWSRFSCQSRLMEGLACSCRWLPSALKKSRIFVLPSEPLYAPIPSALLLPRRKAASRKPASPLLGQTMRRPPELASGRAPQNVPPQRRSKAGRYWT